MTGPGNETLTAALRRLADERASGLLSVATPGRDVVVELDQGAPVAIGPVHDVTDRLRDDADGIAAVAAVDALVDRMVAAIVTGDADWTWDVTSDDERIPVPEGLTQELARRAVDAAQALAALDPDDVLEPGRAVETSGELDRVRQLFDGERTLEEVAAAADHTLATVATMAAALLAGGAVALDEPAADDEPEPASWTDTVAAADEDEDDDEPELWVMDPPDEDDDEDEDEAAASAADAAPTAQPVAPRPEPAPDPSPATEQDESEPEEPAAAAAAEPAAADAPAANWNDTSWLDDLSTRDEGDAAPVLAAGDDDAAAALGSMLADLEDEELFGSRSSDEGDDAPEGDDDQTTPLRHEPRAEPGDVAEFLRELSRLALDDD